MYNEAQPTFFQAPGRIVVIGDVHGDVQRFLHCLYAAKVFNTHLEWIAEPRDTIVIQLGDQIDSLSRGPSETQWENLCDVEMIHLADRLDSIARLQGGRVLSLLGNHELMNVTGDFTYVSSASQQRLPLHRRQQMFRPGGSIAKILAKRNVVLKVGSMLFCHAGLLPHHMMLVDDQIHKLNEIMRKFLKGLEITQEDASTLNAGILDPQGLLWTRMYVELGEANMEVLASAVQNVLDRAGARRIFVGHNTVPQITGILEGRVFFIDAGLSRAYGTDRIHCIDIMHPDTEKEQLQVLTITNSAPS